MERLHTRLRLLLRLLHRRLLLRRLLLRRLLLRRLLLRRRRLCEQSRRWRLDKLVWNLWLITGGLPWKDVLTPAACRHHRHGPSIAAKFAMAGCKERNVSPLSKEHVLR